MNIQNLSLSVKDKDAIRNIMQSLENARTYCSYMENNEACWELQGRIERFIKRMEKEINELY